MLKAVAEDPQIASSSKRFYFFKRMAEMELVKIYLREGLKAESLHNRQEADSFCDETTLW